MKYVRADRMRAVDKLEEEIENLERLIEKAREENKQLKDEVDSLWFMVDEIAKSDVENFSHLIKELKDDVISRVLMTTKKKVDC